MKIHSVESLAALDGEGVRYALFLGGCPLRCVYCHNPDTWTQNGCQDMSVELLFSKIRRYKPYFKNGGGVTFSGGEPLLQAEEILLLTNLLSCDGIGYAIDTSGQVPLSDYVKKVVDGADLIILDLKFANALDYNEFCGGDIEMVLDFADYAVSNKKRIWFRSVIIPGINDNEQYIDKLLDTAKPYLADVERFELLGFHTMGFFKYDGLGVRNPLSDTPPMDPSRLLSLQNYLDFKKGLVK